MRLNQVRLNAEQRMKILKMAFEICSGSQPPPGVNAVIETYMALCNAIQTIPDRIIDMGWIEKLAVIEDHFGGPAKAAEALGTRREMWWKLKRMTSPSPTYESRVELLFSKISANTEAEPEAEPHTS